MGGKGGGSSYIPTAHPPSEPNYTEVYGPIIQWMQKMTEANMKTMSEVMKTYQAPALPEVEPYTPINWEQRQQELYNRVNTLYTLDKARKLSTADMVLTSPLLDEEEAETTTALLGG